MLVTLSWWVASVLMSPRAMWAGGFTPGRSNYAGVREARLRAGPSGLESANQLWRTTMDYGNQKLLLKKLGKE